MDDDAVHGGSSADAVQRKLPKVTTSFHVGASSFRRSLRSPPNRILNGFLHFSHLPDPSCVSQWLQLFSAHILASH